MDKYDRVKRALLAMQRHSWEQGVAMQAFWEEGDHALVAAMARDAVCRQLPDGRAAVVGGDMGVTDPCCCGEALLSSANKTGDPALGDGAARLLSWALKKAPRAKDGTVYHLLDRQQIWVDSIYMLPPFLAAAGEYTEAFRQAEGMYMRLHDDATGLMRSRWDEAAASFCAPEFWGVGNGWTLSGLTRLQALLPETMAGERDILRERVRSLLTALRPHTRPDGLFHNVVDDPASFPETNLPQMAASTIYRGVREGWLNRSLLPWAHDLRRAAEERVDELGFVTGVCGAPRFDAPGIAPEGQAFFLMMETQRQLLEHAAP